MVKARSRQSGLSYTSYCSEPRWHRHSSQVPCNLRLDKRAMPVKTHEVFCFRALCEEQSFTRAARRCGIAQPSLTRAIQTLESEFGGRLFELGKSTLTLNN